jgi:2-hydroxychromene-2-carboxylate isomerase
MVQPKGGKLTIYVDCGLSPSFDALSFTTNARPTVSPYSWFGFTNILRYRPLLNAHGVSVNIIPFFLGGARESVGNPWTPTPKWKEEFAAQDSQTTGQLLGLKIVQPKDFPILSLYVSI